MCGSTGGISGSRGAVVAKIAVNSTLSAVSSSLSTILWGMLYEKKVDSMNANNGILAGNNNNNNGILAGNNKGGINNNLGNALVPLCYFR